MTTARATPSRSRWRTSALWFGATFAETLLVFSVYDQILLGNFPPTTKVEIEFYSWLLLVGAVTSFTVVWALSQLRYLVLAFPLAVFVGLVLAAVVGSITYGSEGESLNGLIFRALGGGIVGGVAALIGATVRCAHYLRERSEGRRYPMARFFGVMARVCLITAPMGIVLGLLSWTHDGEREVGLLLIGLGAGCLLVAPLTVWMSNRDFLAMIDPETGYISDDEDDDMRDPRKPPLGWPPR